MRDGPLGALRQIVGSELATDFGKDFRQVPTIDGKVCGLYETVRRGPALGDVASSDLGDVIARPSPIY